MPQARITIPVTSVELEIIYNNSVNAVCTYIYLDGRGIFSRYWRTDWNSNCAIQWVEVH